MGTKAVLYQVCDKSNDATRIILDYDFTDSVINEFKSHFGKYIVQEMIEVIDITKEFKKLGLSALDYCQVIGNVYRHNVTQQSITLDVSQFDVLTDTVKMLYALPIANYEASHATSAINFDTVIFTKNCALQHYHSYYMQLDNFATYDFKAVVVDKFVDDSMFLMYE